jgi:hypothetical protein
MNRQEYENLPQIEKIKSRITSELGFRVYMIVQDCQTFGRVRLDQHEWYDDSICSGHSLGGGNFVMAHALLALLNLLAKTYRFLAAPDEFATEASRELVRQSIEQIKAASNDKAVKATEHGNSLKEAVKIAKDDKNARWRKPQLGAHYNETKAFGQLAMSVREHVGLGCSTQEEAEDIWRQFRNQLAHMALPEGVTGVWVHTSDYPTYESCVLVTRGRPAFVRAGNGWQCDVDRLTHCVPEIADWVCGEIVRCENDTLLRNLLMWMTGSSETE